MLKYLITATEDLIAAGALLGMLLAYFRSRYGLRGRNILSVGALLGLLAAAVMAWMKNKTKLIDTGLWNLRIFSVSIAAFLLLLILDQSWLRRKRAGGVIVPGIGAILGFNLLFYALPDVLAYPYNFVLGGENVLSTGFLYRLIGLALGVLLAVVTGAAVRYVCLRMKPGAAGALLKAALGINALQQATKILQTLLTRRIIRGHWIFVLVRFTANHGKLFAYLILLTALAAPVVMWVQSLRQNEPYENPAQRRKIQAKWRSVRRWCATAVCCFACGVLIMTAVNAYANQAVELSPAEDCELREDACYVPLSQVDDGSLHRFAYQTPDGVSVRFIVIKKPNSSAYGIGLDACDICGETGYYQRGEQVVCKLCDVVMNVNTIGFKGGCNPIVIDYSIQDGYIIVPYETLIAHQDEFK